MKTPLLAALLVVIGLVVSACGAPSATNPAMTGASQASGVTATPDAVLAELSAAASLEATAADLAAALGVEPQAVRVRVETSTCSVCTGQEDAELHAAEGLSLADAATRLVPGDGFYLFVGDFTCYYRYDGATYTPRICEYAPA